jgi:enoyl-CoA hydratase
VTGEATGTVVVTRRGPVTVVTIDRPARRNALDGATIGAIGRALVEAERDEGVRAVVLTGAGDAAFCSGLDLKAFAAGGREAIATASGPGLEVLTTRCYGKPVIAAVNGAAIGGGFELVLASDLVIAAAHATFAAPEVKRGLVSAGCSTRLAGRLAPAIVYEFTLLGEPISASRAAALGLVNEVVDGAAVLDRSLALADQLAANAPLALEVTKALVYDELATHDAADWHAIRAKAAWVFDTDDAREGAAAFAERRPPRWIGR